MKISTTVLVGLFLGLFFKGQQLNAQVKITDTKIGINRATPNVAIDAVGLNPDDAALLNLANSDETHQLLFFPGRLNDPNPFIQWTDGDPLRFVTTQAGFTELMRIQADGNVGIGTDLPVELLDVNGNIKGIKFIGDGSMLTNIAQQDLSLSGDTLNLTNDATFVDLGGFINNWTISDGKDAVFGYNNLATADSSSAFGYLNQATGDFSNAFGYFNQATGENSSAFGYFNQAIGNRSSAFGYSNEATKFRSNAFGIFNEAIGENSIAFGAFNDATGENSSAFGYSNDATATQSSAFGYGTLSDVYGLMAVGRYNADPVGSATTWETDEPIFVIGNGENVASRSTALTILKNGKVGIGTTDPQEKLHVDGAVRIDNLPVVISGSNIVVDGLGRLSIEFGAVSSSENAEKIEALEKENQALKNRLLQLEQLVSSITISSNSSTPELTTTVTSASLSQNAPNPFTEATNIDYFIPEGTKSASLQVLDQNGRVIKRIPIQGIGKGQITLQANLLSAGTYSYSLILDGRVMETKQMVLTH